MKIINKFATIMASSYVSDDVKEMYVNQAPDQTMLVTASAGERITSLTTVRHRIQKKTKPTAKGKKKSSATNHIQKQTSTQNNKSNPTNKQSSTRTRKQEEERRKQEGYITAQQRKEREEEERKRDEGRKGEERKWKEGQRRRRERENDRGEREEERRRIDRWKGRDENERRRKKRKIIEIEDESKTNTPNLTTQLTNTFAAVGSGFLEWIVKHNMHHSIKVDDPVVKALHSTVFPHGKELASYYSSLGIEPVEVNCFCCLYLLLSNFMIVCMSNRWDRP